MNTSTQPLIQLVIRLWSHITTRRRLQFKLLLALMILVSFTEVISIGAVLPFLGALTAPDRIFEHSATQPFIHALGLTSADQLLLPLTILFSLAAIVAGTLRILLSWASIRLSFAAGADLGLEMYRRTLYQPYSVYITRNSSEVINGISTQVNVVIFYILMPTLTLISSVFMLLTVLGILLFIIPVVALEAFVGFGLIYALIIRVARNRLKSYSHSIARESTNVIKSLQEGLGGMRDILLDGSQSSFCNIYRNADQALRRAQGNNQFVSISPRYGMEALGMLLIAILAYILAKQSNGISNAIPMLAALALGMQRLLPVLQQAYGAWSNILGGQASMQGALELLDQQLPAYAEQGASHPMLFQKKITLNHISFSYSPQTPKILKNISLTITKGSRVGFIGATGSGKSTLLDIIMALLQPTEGTLKVDDQHITAANHRAWQSHIAHVPQAIFLADSSVEENIAFGVPKDQIDFERVKQAAQQAKIADIIETWPLQYQTSVGERGIQLSGGQRQRIGIARALYKQADVIVFDEATSALDNETEQAVMDVIEGLSNQVTILIIAHRLTTIKNCTQIIEIGNGKIQQMR